MGSVPSTRRRLIQVGGVSTVAALFGGRRTAVAASEQGSEVSPDVVGREFPRQDEASVREIVSAAHGRHDRVVELVTARPALAVASWDWGFGDWESALGAASHMGLRDTADFLVEHGARPNLFTYVMLGSLAAVRAMVEAQPGVQRIRGPHGITLLQHARTRLSRQVSDADRRGVEEVQAYLESVGDADDLPTSLEVDESDQERLVGVYRFGQGHDELLNVSVNTLGMLAIERPGGTLRGLRRVEDAGFAPAGAPAVRVRFEIVRGKAASLTVHDPVPLVRAVRVATD